ncbi:MAG: hypothetical protein IPL79_15360 [Myxococcales bacterium]|nr:hypothetical protein [Myxococcales bacterium]
MIFHQSLLQRLPWLAPLAMFSALAAPTLSEARAEPSPPTAAAPRLRWGAQLGLRLDGRTYGFSATNPYTSTLSYPTLRLQLETSLGRRGHGGSPYYAIFAANGGLVNGDETTGSVFALGAGLGARHCVRGKAGCVGVRVLAQAHRATYDFKFDAATVDAVLIEPSLTWEPGTRRRVQIALTPIDMKLPWRVKTSAGTTNSHDAIFGIGLSVGVQW